MPALRTGIALAALAAALWGCAHDVVLGDYVPERAEPASGGAADELASGGHGAGATHGAGGSNATGGWHAAGGWHGAGGWTSMGGMSSQPDDDLDEEGPIGPGPQDEGGPGPIPAEP
jgi:hypothetical protein